MYCDGSFGPIMIRKDHLKSLGSKYKSNDELISFFMNEAKNMRIVHCPDCMFYVNQPEEITKESFQHVAQRFRMTRNGQQFYENFCNIHWMKILKRFYFMNHIGL